MTDSDYVLDMIDGCLSDYAMGVDAMRWNPDAAETDAPWQRAHADGLAGVGDHRREAASRPSPLASIPEGTLILHPDVVSEIRWEVMRQFLDEQARVFTEAMLGVGAAAQRAGEGLRGILPALHDEQLTPVGFVCVPDRPLPLRANHAGPQLRRHVPGTLGTVRTTSAQPPFPRRRP